MSDKLREEILFSTTNELIKYFELTSLKVTVLDKMGTEFFANGLNVSNLQSKLDGLKKKGFTVLENEDSVTYNKFVMMRGQTNVSLNKRNQRLTLAVSV